MGRRCTRGRTTKCQASLAGSQCNKILNFPLQSTVTQNCVARGPYRSTAHAQHTTEEQIALLLRHRRANYGRVNLFRLFDTHSTERSGEEGRGCVAKFPNSILTIAIMHAQTI